MTFDERRQQDDLRHEYGADSQRVRSDQAILGELVKVLTRHPGGLRRWSVMRAIRKDRELANRDIPQKFEDEIERTFRRHCADADASKARGCAPEQPVFYRPKDKAGEVWAMLPDGAKPLP
ncbi:MAG TPA: hypothetical protein VG891_06215 [Rhizomicrobium sp.]|nr:hypothetical protein [Rhizomicrobium sp.]